MKNKTAVDYLISHLSESFVYNFSGIIEKAKKIEKDQIIDAWIYGENDGSLEVKTIYELAEQFYNEKYK